MDVNFMKQLAKRLLAYLQPQLGPAFKLGHAQDLIAALSGLRRWPEVQAFPDKVAGTELTLETVHRLCRRIEERFKTQVAAEDLLDALSAEAAPVTARRRDALSETPRAWICDVCHQPIESVARGYVIWKSEPGGKDHSFKIIHQSDCDRDDHDSSLALEDFLGQDGLNLLLTYLSPGPIRKHFERGPRSSIPELDEFVDFIRRVQIPYYDAARVRFKHPQVREDFRDSGELLPYRPETLKRISEDPDYES